MTVFQQSRVRTGLGQSSRRFLPEESKKLCSIGGVIFDEVPGFMADSDGDIVFHALCQAITSLTAVDILGEIADELFKRDGITESRVYLTQGRKLLGNQEITHVAISIEGKKPKLVKRLEDMRQNVATALQIPKESVGITVISGEGLSDFACGDGMQCFAVITTVENIPSYS